MTDCICPLCGFGHAAKEPAKVIEEVHCPDCNGAMVARTNRQSGEKFWGCKKYPDCKGTRDNMGRSKADKEAEKLSNILNEDKEITQQEGFKFQRR